MSPRRPRLFIGSAHESLTVAEALNELLRDAADVTVWTQLPLPPGSGFLEYLEANLTHYDYGIFVLTGDDPIEVRGEQLFAPRDNVVFELGMFVGRLGRFNSFFVVPKGTAVRLPSDLKGVVHVADFDHARVRNDPHVATAELAVAAAQIKRNMAREIVEPPPPRRLLRSDTEMPGEMLARVRETTATLHEAIVNWTVQHEQRARDEFRNVRDELLLASQFEMRQIVMVHHAQHYREVLGMMRSLGSSIRYALRYIPPGKPPLPLFNYWAFDLEDFFFETANYDRARTHTTVHFHLPNDQNLSAGLHGYFQDLWDLAAANQLASGGHVFWDEAIELGSTMTLDALDRAAAVEIVDHYRLMKGPTQWVNADLVPRQD